MTQNPAPRDDDDLLAAEYVLGVLEAEERALAEVRLRRDAVFAAAVADWENRLSGLNDGFAPVPAPNLMPRIEERLFGKAAPAPRRNWFGWLAGAGTALALAVAVLAVLPPPVVQGPDLGPVLGTQMTADAQPLRYEARYANGALTVTRVAGSPAEAGRVHQLWLIAGNAAPVSLGLITGDSLETALPDALAPGMVLAVSLEPAGGSPTGLPTGPVLVTGAITQL